MLIFGICYSCALVHRSWVPYSRLHLFASIQLTYWNRDAAVCALGPGSTAAGHVRRLEIIYSSFVIRHGDGGDHDAYQRTTDLFPQVLFSELPAVESLLVSDPVMITGGPDATTILSTFAPQLKSLELDRFTFDTVMEALDIFSTSRSMEVLVLRDVFYKDVGGDDTSILQYPPPPSLRAIECTLDYPVRVRYIFDWLHLSRYTLNVRSLTFGRIIAGTIGMSSISPLLQCLGHVLEHLSLDFDLSHDPGVQGM